jgi:hypothetical protein
VVYNYVALIVAASYKAGVFFGVLAKQGEHGFYFVLFKHIQKPRGSIAKTVWAVVKTKNYTRMLNGLLGAFTGYASASKSQKHN